MIAGRAEAVLSEAKDKCAHDTEVVQPRGLRQSIFVCGVTSAETLIDARELKASRHTRFVERVCW